MLASTVLRRPFLFSFQYSQLALPLLFVTFGMIMGSWAGRIPALRDGLQLSHSSLSVVLLCGGLGALLSFPISARMITGLGGRKTLLYSGLALLMVLVGIGLAPTMPVLMIAVLMLGITASCFDVGINSVATATENATGKLALSRLHAWGCGGGLLGAALGSLMASMSISPARHFLTVALILAMALWLGYYLLQEEPQALQAEKKTFGLPSGPLVLLGAIGFFGAMAEGSIADWSGVFLKDHFSVSDGFAPLALTVFSVMMLITRIAGDRLKIRFGAQGLLGAGAFTAALGLFAAVFAPNAYVALAGFSVAGLGLALVFPFVFSAAGKQGPKALAGVATMTYGGSLMGPPVIGSVAHGLGMQMAMALIAVFSLVIAAIVSRTMLLK